VDEVRRLLDTDPSQLTARDEHGNIALHHAASRGWMPVVELLLERGCPIDTRVTAPGDEAWDGWTPLHHAAAAGHIEVIQRLLRAGAPVDAPNTSGETPLHVAAWRGQTDAARVLLDARANPNARRKQQVTPLEMASHFGYTALVRLLLTRGADPNARVYDGNAPLHQAAKQGHLNAMQALVESGADIEAARKDGRTPLHIAAEFGQVNSTAYMLSMGADPNTRDSGDITPLALAQQRGQAGTVALLTTHLAARAETESLVTARKAAAKSIPTRGVVEKVVYKNDFAAENIGPEWSTSPLGPHYAELQTTPIPGTSRRFLGDFGSQDVRLTLSKLPAHARVTVMLDLLILNTWDGGTVPGYGPDLWEASVTGGVTLLRTSFFNNTNPDFRKTPMQAFPGDWPLAAHPGRTGAIANDSLPIGGPPDPTSTRRDATYRLTFTFAHTAPHLVLNFAGKNLQEMKDESWGIGRIEVRIGSVAAKRPSR
jgi:ankyrin repeat protein